MKLNGVKKWVEVCQRHKITLSFCLKVVLEGYHRYIFGVKVKTVKLIGGRKFLAAKSGLMPAQIIRMMAFTQIMAIWTPAITL